MSFLSPAKVAIPFILSAICIKKMTFLSFFFNMEAMKWLFLNPFYYQKMAEMSFSVSIHLYFPLIPIILPFLCQKVDRYVTFFTWPF